MPVRGVEGINPADKRQYLPATRLQVYSFEQTTTLLDAEASIYHETCISRRNPFYRIE